MVQGALHGDGALFLVIYFRLSQKDVRIELNHLLESHLAQRLDLKHPLANLCKCRFVFIHEEFEVALMNLLANVKFALERRGIVKLINFIKPICDLFHLCFLLQPVGSVVGA